jgi:hypothetical protein
VTVGCIRISTYRSFCTAQRQKNALHRAMEKKSYCGRRRRAGARLNDGFEAGRSRSKTGWRAE